MTQVFDFTRDVVASSGGKRKRDADATEDPVRMEVVRGALNMNVSSAVSYCHCCILLYGELCWRVVPRCLCSLFGDLLCCALCLCVFVHMGLIFSRNTGAKLETDEPKAFPKERCGHLSNPPSKTNATNPVTSL